MNNELNIKIEVEEGQMFRCNEKKLTQTKNKIKAMGLTVKTISEEIDSGEVDYSKNPPLDIEWRYFGDKY